MKIRLPFKQILTGAAHFVVLISSLAFISPAIAQTWPGQLTNTTTVNTQNVNGCSVQTTYYTWTYTDSKGSDHIFPDATSWTIKAGTCKGSSSTSWNEWSGDQLYYLQATGSHGSLTAVRGFVNPKYKIVGIAYSVPGVQSYVEYTGTTMLGTSTSTQDMFSTNLTTSTSICGSIGIDTCGSGLSGGGVKITGTYTTAYTAESDTSSSYAVNQTITNQIKWGPPNGTGLTLDHGNDIVYVWLNPVLWYTVYPGSGANPTWSGYTYDEADPAKTMEVLPIRLSELLNPSTMATDGDSSLITYLARSWAQNNTDGSGPGLTNQDLLNIAQADPFVNPSYTITIGSDGKTSTDGRFTQTSQPSMFYVPGGDYIYNWSYTTTGTLGQGAKTTNSQGFAMEEQFQADLFFAGLTVDLKQSTTFTWVDQWNSLTTNMMGEQNTVSIQGPTQPYSGPNEFTVFQDNIYGTFMVNPVLQ
ncbi:MAG: hypothetical protein ACYCOR_03915 [Acidobacteriaceae bacterium]